MRTLPWHSCVLKDAWKGLCPHVQFCLTYVHTVQLLFRVCIVLSRVRVSFLLPVSFWLQFIMTIRRFRSQSSIRSCTYHMISRMLPRKTQGFRSSGELSSYANKSCHVQHVYIHNSFNHSLSLTVCIALTCFLCRKSASKVSHSSCTRSSWPYRAASRMAVQPSWRKDAIVDCDTTNKCEVGTVFSKSRFNHSIWHRQSTAFVWVLSLMWNWWYNCYFYYTRLTISLPKSVTWNKLTNTHHLLPGDVNQ